MAFLIEQIKEQKILEMEVNLDDFIKENNISESTMIHTMIFDKEVFEQEKEVREYLKDKYMFSPQIAENENDFTAILVAGSQIDKSSEIKVELRRGIIAIASDLVLEPQMQEINFNDKGEISFVNKFETINLHNGLPYIIEIARVAEGEHPTYGKLKITENHLESMVGNFKSNVTGVDLAVNEDHRKNEAFGWFKDVFLSFDKQTLYGQVLWNTKGVQALSEKEYRYFSPEFRFNYVHPHSKIEHGPTLLGGALTNYPFLKMEAITELNSKQQKDEIMDKKTIDLSVHNEQIVELNNKISKGNADLETVKNQNIELNGKIEKLEKEIEQKKKVIVHEKLFNDGKITKAQLVKLNEGGSMLEVLALNEKMNLEPQGSSETPKEKEINLSVDEKKFADSLGLTNEEFFNYNN